MTAQEALRVLEAHGYRGRLRDDGVLEAVSIGVTKHGAVFERTDQLGSEISARDLRAWLGC